MKVGVHLLLGSILITSVLCLVPAAVWADGGGHHKENKEALVRSPVGELTPQSQDAPIRVHADDQGGRPGSHPHLKGGVPQDAIEIPTLGSLGLTISLGLILVLSIRQIRKGKEELGSPRYTGAKTR